MPEATIEVAADLIDGCLGPRFTHRQSVGPSGKGSDNNRREAPVVAALEM
jgi:hypothetical protein